MIGESPFLAEPSSWLASNRSAVALEDRYPVSPGHSLVVPRRLVSAWWDLSHDERQDVWFLVDEVKRVIDNRHAPDGYNVGFNGGSAAGQTVEHFHVHVIPRYVGDVPNARGGIRSVIPAKPNYLADGIAESSPRTASLVDSRDGRVLKLELLRCLLNEHFDRVDLLVSFIMQSGLRLIERQLDGALDRGADVRVLTTDYLAVTHPDALSRLMDLQRTADTRLGRGTLALRVFEDPVTSFHPKAYLFWSSARQTGRGFVGSNNLSRAGIENGVEWSIETREVRGLVQAFDDLWADPRNRNVDYEWLSGYRQRYAAAARVFPEGPAAIPEADPEPGESVEAPPTPRPIQQDALGALEATREAGHRAGLVVMATGLGKTWLAAFDSHRGEFPRVLFIAHREEILTQARDVFRKVRPDARLGFFTSAEKAADSDVVFATVQTLHRHLGSFPVGGFEYVVVDEFHHASAQSYRKVINHFEPRFLLGLTATPERMDGADLLALCGDNLVYRCDLVDGIERRELAPFRYWGVADTVDFAPIPWRNGRFDPAALEAAVATKERADAAFREWSDRRGERTLAFCASIRHADYMAEHFASLGVASESLHSGSGAHARQMAIERLESGDLSVLFTVDLFNEGVDMPTLDTVLMLRPTESPVVFLQQLGRGLRTAIGKEHLDVVDFVGNHRGFLAPLRTLLSLQLGRPPTPREMADALRDKAFSLPEGCSVDYSLDAVELLNALIRERRSGADDVLRDICLQIAEEDGFRPSALQVALAGGNVRAARARAGGWFEFLGELDLLSEEELRVLATTGEFLRELAVTPMTKSFKMVLLQALLRQGSLRSGMPVDDLAAQSLQLMQGDPRLAADVDSSEVPSIRVVETTKWQRYWERNPIAAWTGGPWFELQDDQFVPRFQVPAELADPFDAMVAELVEWRLHAYFTSSREASAGDGRPVLRLFHSSGSPILRLDRNRYAELPTGPTEFLADGERYTGHFVKIALNKATRGSESTNVLPSLLRRWFGPSAGLPGTSHSVILEKGPSGWTMSPLRVGTKGSTTRRCLTSRRTRLLVGPSRSQFPLTRRPGARRWPTWSHRRTNSSSPSAGNQCRDRRPRCTTATSPACDGSRKPHRRR